MIRVGRLTSLYRQCHAIARTLAEKASEPLSFVKLNENAKDPDSLSKISEALSAIEAAKLEMGEAEALNLIEKEREALEESAGCCCYWGTSC